MEQEMSNNPQNQNTGFNRLNQNMELKKLTPVTELIKKSFTQSFNLFLGAFLISIIPGICIFVSVFIGVSIIGVILAQRPDIKPLIILPILIFGLPALYFIGWQYASIFAFVTGSENRITKKESLKIGWKMALPCIVIYIWVVLIISGGILGLIIPGILFAIWFSISPFVLFCENLRGRNALVRSKNLIKGYWWPVFGRLFVLLLITVAIFGLFGFIQETMSDLKLFWIIVNMFLDVFWMLLLSIFFFLLYKDLSGIKGPMSETSKGFPKNWAGILFLILGILAICLWFAFIIFGSDKIKSEIKKSQKDAITYKQIMLSTALNVYYGDAEGTFPKSLDLLVPEYIDEIPNVRLEDNKWDGEEKNTWKFDPTPETDILKEDIDETTTWMYNSRTGTIMVNKSEPDLNDFFSSYFYSGKDAQEPDKKIEYYTKALENQKPSESTRTLSEVYHNRGLVYGDKGEYDRAIEDYNKAIELDPKYWESYMNLGFIYLKKGEYARALENYNKTVEINPDSLSYNNRGFVYFDTKEYESALKDFEKAATLNPKNMDTLLGLAVTCLEMNNIKKAKEYLNKAIKLNPELKNGMKSIEKLEKEGYFYTQKQKESLKKLFNF